MENEFEVKISSKKLGKSMCHLTEDFLIIGDLDNKTELIQLSNLQSIKMKRNTLILQVKRAETELTVSMSNKKEKILLEWNKILNNFFLTISSDKIKRENMRGQLISDLEILIGRKRSNMKRSSSHGSGTLPPFKCQIEKLLGVKEPTYSKKLFDEQDLLELQKNSDLTFMEIYQNLKKESKFPSFYSPQIRNTNLILKNRRISQNPIMRRISLLKSFDTPIIPLASNQKSKHLSLDEIQKKAPKRTSSSLIIIPSTKSTSPPTESTKPNDEYPPKGSKKSQESSLQRRTKSLSLNLVNLSEPIMASKNDELGDYKENFTFDEIIARRNSAYDTDSFQIPYKDHFETEYEKNIDSNQTILPYQNDYGQADTILSEIHPKNDCVDENGLNLSPSISRESSDDQSPRKYSSENSFNFTSSSSFTQTNEKMNSESTITESIESRSSSASSLYEQNIEPFHVWNQALQKAFDYIHNKESIFNEDVIE